MTVTVELFVNDAWLDITRLDNDTYVCSDITITRGRSDDQGQVSAAQVEFDYLDLNALLDTDNPYSVYYRKISVPGTPLRVKKDGAVRVSVTLDSMEPTWSDGAENVVVHFRAVGVLDKYESASVEQPLRSPAYRAYTSVENDATRIVYFPLEEEDGATRITSPYPGVGQASFTNPITFGAFTSSVSSERMVTFGDGGQISVLVPSYTSSEHKLVGLWHYPSSALGSDTIMYRIFVTGGNITHIDLVNNTSGLGAGCLQLIAYNGTVIVDSTTTVDFGDETVLDTEFIISLEFTQDGADLDTLTLLAGPGNDGDLGPDTLTAVTIGRIRQVVVGATPPAASINGASFGHFIIGNDTGAFPNYISPVNGALGTQGFDEEPAVLRASRIADEENETLTIVGTGSDSVQMGVQEIQSFLELLRSCEAADLGILYEDREDNTLILRARTSLYNQAPVAMLDYEHIMPGFQPTSGSKKVANDVTVSRSGGGSARYIIPDGDPLHYTTEDPPDGMGTRQGQATVATHSDDLNNEIAAWLAHLGSWREKRYPSVTMELSRDSVSADDETAILALDIGDVFTLATTGAPRWVAYSELRLMVQGYTEVLNQFTHSITFNTTPADIYEVEVVDSGESTLVVAIDDNDTSLKLATGDGPEWSTTDEPYHIQVAGQPMTVTAMVTDTPAFIAAGAIANGNNAAITPALPAGITPDVGQLLLIWATIRNSGTGVPDDETGWDTIVSFGNTKLYGRYYVTGDAAPQITFTGGVANADTQARMFAFSGLSMELASGTKETPAAHTQLNGSAANIAYPLLRVNRSGAVALIFAWKQDDWTSVADPSGFTEMADNATTTGDDSGIAAYYDLTGVSAGTGSLTVTGGASAISRAVVLALRPLQTATVTRNIAGVATSASAGAEVHSWRPGINGL